MPHLFFEKLERRRSTQVLLPSGIVNLYGSQLPIDPNIPIAENMPIYGCRQSEISIFVNIYGAQLPDPNNSIAIDPNGSLYFPWEPK